MVRLSLQRKLAILVMGLVLLVMSVVTITGVRREIDAKRAETRDQVNLIAQMTAISVGKILSPSHREELDAKAEEICQRFVDLKYLRIYDIRGGVLSEFIHPKIRSWLGGVEPLSLGEIGLWSNRERRFVKQKGGIKSPVDVEYVTPVRIYSQDFGYLQLGFSDARLHAAVRAIIWQSVPMTVAMLLLGGVGASVLARRISRPIRHLSAVASELGAGRLEARAAVKTGDEVEVLGNVFNGMAVSLQSRIQELEVLQEMSARISSVLERDMLRNLIVKTFADHALVDRISLMEFAEDNPDELEVKAGFGLEEVHRFFRLPRGQGLAGQVVETQMHQIVENIAEFPDRKQFYKEEALPGKGSIPALCIPLLVKGEARGVVTLVEPKVTDQGFPRERVLFLTTLANQAAIALENARLYDEAITDGLTKVYVHRFFQYKLEEEVRLARRSGRPLTLLMLDIDHFKRLNDTYGHQQGDMALIEMARIMKTVVRVVDTTAAQRRPDIVARYGGEEFMIILPETAMPDAMGVAERLRKTVEEFQFTPVAGQEAPLKVTVSLGLAGWTTGLSRETLIAQADKALYRSKHGGRNRVSVYDDAVDGQAGADNERSQTA